MMISVKNTECLLKQIIFHNVEHGLQLAEQKDSMLVNNWLIQAVRILHILNTYTTVI